MEDSIMRKYLIPCVATLVVLAACWVVFGQAATEQRQRFAQSREMQLKAVAALVEQAGKLKTVLETPIPGMPAGGFQSLSEEERTKMRETMTKRREEQQQIVGAIEMELAKVKGARQLQREQEEGTKELQAIRELAEKEQAKGTLKGIDELIAKRQKAFEDKLAKLGLQLFQRPGSGQ
jgi:hypothetical protein